MKQQVKEFDSLLDLLEDLEREGITGYQKRVMMDRFLLNKSRMMGRPYCASFELTPLCNFDCKMCYVHLNREQMQKAGRILSTSEWLNIMRQSVDAGATCIDLTGGECLLHPGFKEIYQYLVKRGVHVSVLTNGQLIDEDTVKLFQQYPPAVVQISVYGSSREAYLRVTGRDAFQDVMNAIDLLKAANVRVSLSVTPNRFMQADVKALLELIRSKGVKYRIGSTTLPARPETERDIADYIVDNKVLIELSKLEEEYRKSLDLVQEKSDNYKFRIKGEHDLAGAPCSAGASNFHINWRGEMQPCLAFHTVCKSVLDTSVQDAWNWIRNAMQAYKLPTECEECVHADFCSGCPAERTAGYLTGALNKWVCKRSHDLVRPDCVVPMCEDV